MGFMQWDSGSRANIDVSCENVSSHPNPIIQRSKDAKKKWKYTRMDRICHLFQNLKNKNWILRKARRIRPLLIFAASFSRWQKKARPVSFVLLLWQLCSAIVCPQRTATFAFLLFVLVFVFTVLHALVTGLPFAISIFNRVFLFFLFHFQQWYKHWPT